MSDLLEKYPIGSRWVDIWGDHQIVVGRSRSNPAALRTIEFLDDGELCEHDWASTLHEDWTPYVEPEPTKPLPAFKHFGWVHPTTHTVRTGYLHVLETDPTSRTFEYGIEGNELFIRWTGDE